jgi:hypothetical protein
VALELLQLIQDELPRAPADLDFAIDEIGTGHLRDERGLG